MIINKFETNEEWLNARKGKITGSRLKDIIVKRGSNKKIGFYKLIAEKIAIPRDEEDAMERGHRLEEVAIKKFQEVSGLKVNSDLVMWVREDNENIALSPDGYEDKKIPTWAIEVKCLASERHLEAYISQEIPKEYEDQALQYFIVNDNLEKLYFTFYDDRIPSKPFFFKVIERKNIQKDIDTYLEYQKNTLAEVEKIIKTLTF